MQMLGHNQTRDATGDGQQQQHHHHSVSVPFLERYRQQSTAAVTRATTTTSSSPSVGEAAPSLVSPSSLSSSPAAADKSTPESTLPLPQSLGLAAVYILASILYFLCIRYSKANYTYDGALPVLVIECTKLAASVALKYREDGEFLPRTVFFGKDRRAVWRGGLPYAIPSLLYAVYNNLTFFNLSAVDPGTYQVFM